MDYMEIGVYGLKVDCRVLNFLQDRIRNSSMATATIHHNQILDVEYEELEPDPNDGPAPMATLVYNPKKINYHGN